MDPMAPPSLPTGLSHGIMFSRDESKIHMYFVYSILNMHVMCLLLTYGYNFYVLCFCALAREPKELARAR